MRPTQSEATVTDTPLTPPMSDLAGTAIGGRYRLTRPLASGGMARVWEARDEVLDRLVAVKMLFPHLAADPTFRSRFHAEAIAAARLSHPSIVSIFDTVSNDDVEAIVMELIRGITLRQFLDEYAPLSVRDAVDVAIPVADALAAAHEAGIVHRDVKPGNIMLCEDRRVKVTDFGIAKATGGGDITNTGTLIGTAKYLSPEQVEGVPVDGRSDVYALSVVLYECLAGATPFTGENDTAVALARLRTDPPPLGRAVPGLDPAVEHVVMRGLTRDRELRHRSAEDFAAALRTLVDAADHLDGYGPDPSREPTIVVARPTTHDPTATAPAARRTAVPTPTGAPRPAAPRIRPPRRRGRVLSVVAAALAALAVAGILFAQTDLGGDIADDIASALGLSDGGSSEQVLAVEGVRSFDPPPGSGVEHDDIVDLLIDGDPATVWDTETYRSPVADLKPGVGVVLDLSVSGPADVVVVESPDTGWTAQVYIGDGSETVLADWGEPVDTVTATSATTPFDLDGREGRSVLIWLTDLGEGPPYQVAIGEIRVLT